MKVTVTRKDFADSLALASTASSTRAALPVLASIRLAAENGSLSLLGCDGEMWAESICAANVQVPGAVCVQRQLLSEIVGALPDGEVLIELEGTSVYIRQGHSEFKMMALPADEFPPIPDVGADSELKLPFGDFRKAVAGVQYACSDDSSRPVLTGVLFNYDGTVLTLVATDTHRLAVHKIHRSGIGSTINVTVPAKALKAIRQLRLDAAEPITVRFDSARLAVDTGSGKVVSQLLNGQYPNWERVVPVEHTRAWTVDRSEFQENLRRALILAKDNANRVKFMGQGDMVIISSRSEDKGEAKEEVACVSSNGDMKIAFNGQYVMEALAAIDCDGIKTEMTEPSRPAVIRPTEGGEDHFCVVMPMAVD
ncbi:MAG TPA: DNA polymerase III subunit beta [Fimbriimonadaceae bacterium]|nr:DNA polymerase III subunit beta [Fimbriimonadaceae bacterium]